MRKKFLIVLSIILVLLFFCIVWVIYDYFNAVETTIPTYTDITSMLEKDNLTDEDYTLLFQQTGLGRCAVEDLRTTEKDFVNTIKDFQDQRQEPLFYKQTFLFFPTTTAEQLKGKDMQSRLLMLPPLQGGDILITKSTKTLLFRHGHAGLVLNGGEQTAESMMIGTTSTILEIDNWRSYPTLMILRPKQREHANKAEQFARQNMLGIPYNLLTGLIKKDKADESNMTGTQCAHFVWQAYHQVGIELDFDGGWLVTPYDLANNHDLDMVFSYGFGEDGRW
ncbi:MAG: hypothetical protein E7393_02910 [Ruminococcaceae bacterium]|nr:hypothetical protein [Oscillospiraceae bacterium]